MPFSIKLDAFRRALAVITNHSKNPDPNSWQIRQKKVVELINTNLLQRVQSPLLKKFGKRKEITSLTVGIVYSSLNS